jgi:molybdate transport system substrate-binding protein
MNLTRLAAAIVLCLSSAACAGDQPTSLTVYGAASLKGALEQAATAYAAVHEGMTVVVSTDASSTLETQIEQGAPADVFLSADTKNPQTLADKGLTDGPAVNFAANELVVIVPTENPAGITSAADLARSGVKVIAAGDEVPITKYANQVVANLADQPDYPPDFIAGYAANIATKEDNVKAAVAKVELGEGDAAIVYATDGTASNRVSAIAIPDGANVPATYAGVVVKASPNVDDAHAFLTWLTGPEGQAILAGYGFLPPA